MTDPSGLKAVDDPDPGRSPRGMMDSVDGINPGGYPPPGWFSDPGGQPGWRWWTGDRWSEHYAPWPSSAVASGPPDQQTAAYRQANQARLDGFMAWAPWIWVSANIAILLIDWAGVGYYRALWHWWHAVLHAANAGQTLPVAPQRPLWSTLASLTTLAVLPVEILFLVWQYRAAQVARALRYPAAHSPGWGVGCWFVPVVNLWMPYQALRDCLPPGHRARRYVLSTWIMYLSVAVLGTATVVALVGAPDLGVALVFLWVAAQLLLGLNAYRAAKAIAADHRHAVLVGDPTP
jgi:Domain of unknown function (DUF4328)/Protein of unknown function (DUF2510)